MHPIHLVLVRMLIVASTYCRTIATKDASLQESVLPAGQGIAQILGHVFGSENIAEATVVEPNALKNSSYEYFVFYFYKMVKNRLFFKQQSKKLKKSYIQLQK